MFTFRKQFPSPNFTNRCRGRLHIINLDSTKLYCNFRCAASLYEFAQYEFSYLCCAEDRLNIRHLLIKRIVLVADYLHQSVQHGVTLIGDFFDCLKRITSATRWRHCVRHHEFAQCSHFGYFSYQKYCLNC